LIQNENNFLGEQIKDEKKSIKTNKMIFIESQAVSAWLFVFNHYGA
jgi:hypothetical protein